MATVMAELLLADFVNNAADHALVPRESQARNEKKAVQATFDAARY